MIKLFNKKITAKQAAARIIESSLDGAHYYTEQNFFHPELPTEKELQEIDRHLRQFEKRIAKLLKVKRIEVK